MLFDAQAYGSEVASILAAGEDGRRAMPLAIASSACSDAPRSLHGKHAQILFPGSFAPDAALAGLWLYFSCFDESHSITQDLSSAEGSYWHAILHRQEPGAGNAGYWFRRVGRHPVFPELNAEAATVLAAAGRQVQWQLGTEWDPFEYIEFCERARKRPGSIDEQVARAIQLAEWQMLFDYCARRAKG